MQTIESKLISISETIPGTTINPELNTNKTICISLELQNTINELKALLRDEFGGNFSLNVMGPNGKTIDRTDGQKYQAEFMQDIPNKKR